MGSSSWVTHGTLRPTAASPRSWSSLAARSTTSLIRPRRRAGRRAPQPGAQRCNRRRCQSALSVAQPGAIGMRGAGGQLPCSPGTAFSVAGPDRMYARRPAASLTPGLHSPASRSGYSAQVVQRRMTVSEVEPAEGGVEGDARVEPLGEGAVL